MVATLPDAARPDYRRPVEDVELVGHPWRTRPFRHQLDVFHKIRDAESHALFLEMGLGKTKINIDVAAHRYLNGDITGLIVVAPKGVHVNWITDEIPAHLPEGIRWLGYAYDTDRQSTRPHRDQIERLLKFDGFAVLAMSYSGLKTEAGKSLAQAFLKGRRRMMAVDESHRIKSPGSKQTKLIRGMGPHAVVRHADSGTPVTQDPGDLYAQMAYLRPSIWKERGMGTYQAFQSRFAILQPRGAGARQYTVTVGYRDVNYITEICAPHVTRIKKEDALDLPPKLYSRVTFELSPAQRRAYDQLVNEFVAELDDGRVIEAPQIMVRLLRLQQIACGYAPSGDEGETRRVGDAQPRLDLIEELLEDCPHQAIVWCRFTADVDAICAMLGNRCVRYDGRVPDQEDRERAKRRFQGGDAKFFVGNPDAGSEGLTLTAAKTVVYYSNNWKLGPRLQSEDRAHRIGQTHPVSIRDVVARRTVDERIVAALVKKFEVAAEVQGDGLRRWLTEG